MLGLRAANGRVEVDPCIPDEVGRIVINGLRAFGERWDIEANGTRGHVRLAR